MNKALLFSAAFVAAATIGCSSVNPVGSARQAPNLPPETSMSIPAFANDAELGKRAAQQTTIAASLAYLTVTYWTTTVRLALLTPATLFKLCHSTRPSPLPDNSGWVWNVSDNNGFSAELTGRIEHDLVKWTMRVSGGPLSNFIWFTGVSVITGKNGTWTFYDTANGGTPSLSFAYDMSDVQNRVKVTVLQTGIPETGSFLEWTERGNAMSFEAFGAAKNERFLISWDKTTEAGSISNLITGEKYCWDTKENGHADIACQ